MNFETDLRALGKDMQGFLDALQESPQYQEMSRTEKNFAADKGAQLLLEEFQALHVKLKPSGDEEQRMKVLQEEIEVNAVIMEHLKAQQALQDLCWQAAGIISKHLQLDYAAAARTGHHNCSCGCGQEEHHHG